MCRQHCAQKEWCQGVKVHNLVSLHIKCPDELARDISALQAVRVRDHAGMFFYSKAAVERAMKIQEVVLRAIGEERSMWHAAEIPGFSDRPLRRSERSRPPYSLYKKPATTAARIAPTHISSIHPSGNMRGAADQVACAKLPGMPAQNPTIIPILRAVFGPAPAVGATQRVKIRDENRHHEHQQNPLPDENG